MTSLFLYLKNISVSQKLFFFIFICLIAVFITNVIGILVLLPIHGAELLENPDLLFDTQNPKNLNSLRIFQVINSLGIFLLSSTIFCMLFINTPFTYLKLGQKPHIKGLILTSLIVITATPVILFIGELNAMLSLPEFLSGLEDWMKESEKSAAALTEAFLTMETKKEFLLNVAMIALLPAIGEEVMFRGIFQKLFTGITKNIHIGIWGSAALFSAVHLQFYGFLPRMLLGAIFGYTLYWSKSLWVPIAAHFVNNFFAVLASFLFQKGLLDIDINEVENTQVPFVWIFISLVTTMALGYTLFRYFNPANSMRDEY